MERPICDIKYCGGIVVNFDKLRITGEDYTEPQ